MFRILTSLFLSLLLATGATAQGSYKIRTGDTLQIEVLEDAKLNRTALVLPDGNISFPLVGSIRAAGRSVGQVQASLASALASNFASSPNVFVTVGEVAERRGVARGPVAPITDGVFVMGEIRNPGKIEVSRNTTVLQAIAQAGGLTRFAAGKRIQVRHYDPTTGGFSIYRYNYYTNKGDRVLVKGDVIVVPQRKLFE